MDERLPMRFGPNPAELVDRLSALASSPPVLAALEQRATEARANHVAAIARLRAAEKAFEEAERLHGDVNKAFEAEVARLMDEQHKARVKAQAKFDASNLRFRSAENEVRDALTAIRELPAWRDFDVWCARFEQTVAYAYLDHGADADPSSMDDLTLVQRRKDVELRKRCDARRDEADKALTHFRATLRTARTIFASEDEALRACREGLRALKALYALPSGITWPQ